MATAPLIIKDFDQGIADSAHKGLALLRCIDIDEFPGAAKVKAAPSSLFATAFTGTFTADAGTEVCTVSGFTVPATGTPVHLTTTGTLPAGLSTGTIRFIINLSTTTCGLALTIADADADTRVDITDAGSGTHTMTSVNPGTVNHIVKNASTSVRFFHDSNGRVWYLTDGSTRCRLLKNTIDTGASALTNASGNGLVTFLNSDSTATYLLAFRNAVIDIVNVFGTSQLENPTWTNAWNFGGATSDTSLRTGSGTNNRHHAIVAQDNKIYWTDDRFIGRVIETAGTVFNPADTGTYSGTDNALDLPLNEVAVHLEELGTNLLIAGSIFNNIYPWDRTSDSYNLPLRVPEVGVHRLKNIGNLVYILAGRLGKIYTTQGTYVREFKKIPWQVTNNSGTLVANAITWGGIDATKGGLLFGMSVQTGSNSGVYLLTPDGRLTIDQLPSSGATNVTALEVTNDFYYLGYASGADEQTTDRYSNFQGVIQSALYRVATVTEKETYSTLEVQLAKPASSGGNIRVGYRTDTSSSFTTLSTFATDGVATSFKNDAIGLIDIENIQIQVELDDAATGAIDIELLEVRLLP